MPITIVIAEPNESTRLGLRTILRSDPEIQLVGEASTPTETFTLMKTQQPSVLLLEWRMPESLPAEFLSEITQSSPMTKILIVSTWSEGGFRVPLKNADLVSGYLGKHQAEHLVATIRRIAAGERPISPHVEPASSEPAKKRRSRA